MATDWCLRVYDYMENEVIPSTHLITMMIERNGSMGVFSASMIIDQSFLSVLNVTNRNFFDLNYFSYSYPENNFILKDAILTSLSCDYSGSENMHIEASWQYYSENEQREYNNELDFVYNNSSFNSYELNVWKTLLLSSKDSLINWKLFGF